MKENKYKRSDFFVNPACLPVCHPTTSEQLTQASWAPCAIPRKEMKDKINIKGVIFL